jgi:hypothetical protein
VKEAADAAAAREAAEEVAKKKATEEAAVRKMVVDEVAGKKKAAEKAAVKRKVIDQVAVKKDSEEVVKKTKSGAATMGSAHLRLCQQESRGWLRPVALHLWPSGNSTTLGSLGTLCDCSFAISCSTSVILI